MGHGNKEIATEVSLLFSEMRCIQCRVHQEGLHYKQGGAYQIRVL